MKFIFGVIFLMLSYLSAVGEVFPDQLKSIGSWSAKSEKQYFNQANLYDYINGASDFYLSFQFQDLWVVDYLNVDGKQITVELYRHRDANCAFGIYAEERPVGSSLIKLGAEGYIDGGTNFLNGIYYVKMYGSNSSTTIDDVSNLAKDVASALGNDAMLPLELNLFPSQGRVAMSERYTAENYMGIEGFNGVFSSDYNVDDQKFKLFLHQSDSVSCQQFVNKYLSANELVKKIDEECMLVKDKYNGLVLLCVKNNLITGILNHPKPKQMVPVLKQIK